MNMMLISLKACLLMHILFADFSWLEPWTVGDKIQNPLVATFHANGQMVIWELAKEENTNFEAKVIFTKQFRRNDMVTCHRFFRLSETEGMLIELYDRKQPYSTGFQQDMIFQQALSSLGTNQG